LAQPLTYKQRAQIAILADTAIHTVDRYFDALGFAYSTAARDRIAAALRSFGRPDLVRRK
jgi:hypothetical protein